MAIAGIIFQDDPIFAPMTAEVNDVRLMFAERPDQFACCNGPVLYDLKPIPVYFKLDFALDLIAFFA